MSYWELTEQWFHAPFSTLGENQILTNLKGWASSTILGMQCADWDEVQKIETRGPVRK